MRNQKFYICETCGNLVGKIDNGGVPMMCCGKEMKEFCLSEDSDKIYMVKVTSQPNIKALCFDGEN